MRAMDGVRRSGLTVGPHRPIRDAAMIMHQSGVGALAVIDDGRIVGIVTDRDLVRRGLAQDLAPTTPVEKVMSTPVVTIGAEADGPAISCHPSRGPAGQNPPIPLDIQTDRCGAYPHRQRLYDGLRLSNSFSHFFFEHPGGDAAKLIGQLVKTDRDEGHRRRRLPPPDPVLKLKPLSRNRSRRS